MKSELYVAPKGGPKEAPLKRDEPPEVVVLLVASRSEGGLEVMVVEVLKSREPLDAELAT